MANEVYMNLYSSKADRQSYTHSDTDAHEINTIKTVEKRKRINDQYLKTGLKWSRSISLSILILCWVMDESNVNGPF